VNGSGSTYAFLDPTGVKLTIKKSTATGRAGFRLTAKAGSYAVAPPARVDVVLGDGTCFEEGFPGPTPPFCLYNATRTTLLCR
jgi:hypothetical protein